MARARWGSEVTGCFPLTQDGRLPTASVVAAYLLFVGLFASPLTAYKLFNGERCLDGDFVTPPPSHVR